MNPNEEHEALLLAAIGLREHLHHFAIPTELRFKLELFIEVVMTHAKRKPYTTPVLRSLGTVRDLTKGNGSSGPDIGGQQQP